MQYQTPLSQSAYVDLVVRLISGFEGHELQARDIGDGTSWKEAARATGSADSGADYLDGEAGNDLMAGGTGSVTLYGDSGFKAWFQRAGADTLDGDDNDTLQAANDGIFIERIAA